MEIIFRLFLAQLERGTLVLLTNTTECFWLVATGMDSWVPETGKTVTPQFRFSITRKCGLFTAGMKFLITPLNVILNVIFICTTLNLKTKLF